ncbi:undecaprenyl-diphosphate phosphatase [Chamaesiphon polymorphus]|uniref:Undecaprenyl-diphosphatase n=1 Tax=Chamaesiphon polymorphus CCALA 037 TaxID=2107692 RepID=A0A2T1GEX2_9CYAN|nr:undecaprenyl-diphosphate phosphatase [Chamaesiphon polymorphus]PSB56137.1 undecaprenyl-diphosphatase [Chamaesiphon polymorphus CCALA 037]
MTMRSKTKFSLIILGAIAAGSISAIPVVAQPAATSTAAVVADGNIIQAAILGVVQGITEFLPISSTAHLLVTTKVFGWQQLGQKDYADAIQFGSVLAVLIYFWKDLTTVVGGGVSGLLRQDWQDINVKIFAGIIVGTLPALILGFLGKDILPDNAQIIAIMSIVMATLLFAAERFSKHKRGFEGLEIKDGLLVGLAQAIALLPGASRSGSTLTAGLFLGLERETAARFSFLVGLPTLAIATLYKALKIFKENELPIPLLAVGMVSTFIFSYIAIAFLLNYLKTKNTMIFVWYRYAFGASILIALAAGWKA